MFSPAFEALRREASIAAAAVDQGINGLTSASYAATGNYLYAFLNLSTAYERLGKLIFVLDHLLEHDVYPTDADLRKLGHKLSDIIDAANSIKSRRGIVTEEFPADEVTQGIIQTLSEFATSTRYYNLDYLVGGKSAGMTEPVAAWYGSVCKPILDKHYSS